MAILVFNLNELIPGIVYPSTSRVFKKISGDIVDIDLSKLPEIMEFSQIFVERVVSLSKKFITGEFEHIYFARTGMFQVMVCLECKEGAKIGDLITEIVEISTRFQTFFSEVFGPIEDYGVPRLFAIPVIKKATTEISGQIITHFLPE